MQSACFFLWIAIRLQSRPSPRFRFLIDAVEHILAKNFDGVHEPRSLRLPVSRAFLMSFDYASLRERSAVPLSSIVFLLFFSDAFSRHNCATRERAGDVPIKTIALRSPFFVE